jgi:hypothetical protein
MNASSTIRTHEPSGQASEGSSWLRDRAASVIGPRSIAAADISLIREKGAVNLCL